MKYRPDIDGLRSLAVVPVVLAHVNMPFFHGGFVGVDVFFVISGFLITRILVDETQAGTFSVLRFYERRARRILPALFLVLAVVLAVGWIGFTPEGYENLAKSTMATLVFISNLYFWKETGDYFGSTAEIEPLLHTWSLGVEEQFYIFFPVLIWALASKGRATLVGSVAFLSVLSLVLAVVYPDRTSSFFLTPMRVWELGVGALLALGAVPVPRHTAISGMALVGGLAGVLLPVFFYSAQTPFPGIATLVPVLGSALLIHFGAGNSHWVSKGLASRPLVGIGLISYSLYLWHWPFVVWARLYSGNLQLTPTYQALVIVLSFVAAWVSWRFVERPFRRSASSDGMSARVILIGAVSGGALLMVTSVAIKINAGVPARLSDANRTMYTEAVQKSRLDNRCRKATQAGGVCKIGNDLAEPTVFIWGDSHAGSMLDGFDFWLGDQGLAARGAIQAGCPPLLDVVRLSSTGKPECLAHNQEILSYLRDNPGIEFVILAGRWPVVVEGTAPEGPKTYRFLGLDTYQSGARDHDRQAFAKGIEATMTQLALLGRRVLIVESLPEIGYSAPDALLGTELFFAPPRTPLTRDDFLVRNRGVIGALDQASARVEFIRLSPFDILCQETCAVEHGKDILYRDDDHLSSAGARYLIPRLMERLSLGNTNSNQEL